MKTPAWDDPDFKAGSMVKAALWLVQEVGEGNTFTKEQLRAAFPGVSQIDRRVRDLRKYGWSILANTEDASLTAEEQRFVKAGAAVWDREARRAVGPRNALSAKAARAVMERDDFICTVCGISGGEEYPDDPNQTAVLSVTRRTTVFPDGREQVLSLTECKRCRAGSNGTLARADEVAADMRTLDPADRRRLARWIERNRRVSTPLDRVWAAYRRLPADARAEIRSVLDD
ncbi:hypothetical protein GCM10009678_47520 [Actinomadura kijaniata]|uniref:HNH endonuclease n=1 Tax=Actinomadura namibiensis TaxID=182080 RepID=A0A7W3LKW3_ACTNM|nr:hypothetical protein [Actinomadura namibiensis]MBA8949937.1 hypothetical protein [Actinomadura namibiensis]